MFLFSYILSIINFGSILMAFSHKFYRVPVIFFFLCVSIINGSEELVGNFLWEGKGEDHKNHLVSLDLIVKNKLKVSSNNTGGVVGVWIFCHVI